MIKGQRNGRGTQTGELSPSSASHVNGFAEGRSLAAEAALSKRVPAHLGLHFTWLNFKRGTRAPPQTMWAERQHGRGRPKGVTSLGSQAGGRAFMDPAMGESKWRQAAASRGGAFVAFTWLCLPCSVNLRSQRIVLMGHRDRQPLIG